MRLSDYIELMSLGKGQSRKEVLTTLHRPAVSFPRTRESSSSPGARQISHIAKAAMYLSRHAGMLQPAFVAPTFRSAFFASARPADLKVSATASSAAG